MEQDILSCLEAAMAAPSGDNAQPWRVVLSPDGIALFNVAERDTSLYNWDQRAAYVAHGAFIENFVLAAGKRGYSAQINLFPEGPVPEGPAGAHVATLRLIRDPAVQADPLAEAIFKRATNRKVYETTPLSANEKNELLNKARTGGTKIAGEPIVTITFFDTPEERAALGEAVGQNERILFGNQAMHAFFFGHINWNRNQDIQKGSGFAIETLELPPPAKLLFPLWKHWSIMRLFAAIGFPNVIAKENGKLYAKAAGFGAIIIPDTSPQSYLAAGRALERLWLSATCLGLNMQALTGITLLHERIKVGHKDFNAQEEKIITKAHATIEEQVKLAPGEVIAFLCRIGKGPAPSARTVRRTLHDILR